MSQHPFLQKNKFLLGSFASNCSSGMTISTLPERWDASWENNLKLAELLDDAGIDFMLPIARFTGYGGETDFQGSILETMTWTSALLARTQNLVVFATIQTAVNHPVVVAKQIATMSKIGNDRVGLNIVAGWNKPEYEALGLTLPDDHETRYGYAQEWYDLVKQVWESEEAFDFEGKYFQTKGTYGKPRPDYIPPIFNAAGSKNGRGFAITNADFLFTPVSDLSRSAAEVEELKALGRAKGRDTQVMTFSHVICRATEQEAQAEWERQLAHTDMAALDNLMNLMFAHAQSFPPEIRQQLRDRMAVGHGGFPLVGTPEQIADQIVALHTAGFSGTTLSFLDYVEEFPYFGDHVLPLLQAKGLR